MEAIISFIMAMPVLVILVIALRITVTILVIRLICQYMAKQNAKAFDYDYLAERTAKEVCNRLMLIDRQKESAYKGATNGTRDQAEDETENCHANKAPGA